MRIAHLFLEPHHSLSDGSGYAVHLTSLAQAFEAKGHEVCLVVLGDFIGRARDALPPRPKGISVARRIVPGRLWRTARDIRDMRLGVRYADAVLEHVARFCPDVIYERMPFMAGLGPVLAKQLNVPRMSELNAPIALERARDGRTSLLTGYARRLEIASLRTADRVRVVSQALAKYPESVGVPTERILVRPNGVDTTLFSASNSDRRDIRREFDLKDSFVFGFAGSMIWWHRVDALIEAFARIHAACPDTRLLLIGEGEETTRLREAASRTGHGDAIVFAGRQPHRRMKDLYAAMDVCCLSGTNWYGSSLKLLEYGAMGKPIIAPNAEPVREVMEGGKDCVLVESGDVNQLADSMMRLYSDTNLREAIAHHFNMKVRARYSWDAVTDEISDSLEDIRDRHIRGKGALHGMASL
jgi:glycosyltransferase involved in cell wall biosynthesis